MRECAILENKKNTANQAARPREAWLDYLRVLAACSVVMMHTLTGGLDIFTAEIFAQGKWFLLIMDLTTWCVPVFLMVSGYLFLNPARQVTWRDAVGKYALRIVLALFVFGVPYAWIEQVLVARTFRFDMLWKGVWMVLAGKSWSHMWYLYLIALLYLVTPAIKWVLAKAPGWSVWTVEGLLFLGCSALPFVNRMVELSGEKMLRGKLAWEAPQEGIYLFYYLMGYLIGRILRNRKTTVSEGRQSVGGTLCLMILPLGWTMVLLGLIYYRLSDLPQIQMAYNYPPTAVFSVLIMLLGNRTLRRRNSVVRQLADLSFGVYLVHPIFLNVIYKFLGISLTENAFGLRYPAVCAVTLAGAVGLSWVLGRVKVLKKYVL